MTQTVKYPTRYITLCVKARMYQIHERMAVSGYLSAWFGCEYLGLRGRKKQEGG